MTRFFFPTSFCNIASLSSLLENNLQFNYYRKSRRLLNGRTKSAMLLEHEIKCIEGKTEPLYYV